MSENCTRLVKGEFFLNDSGLTLSPKENNVFHTRFLEYLVFSLNDIIFGLGRGTAQKNLDVDAFRCLQIQYPKSLAEQDRIVGILDEAFAGIAAATAHAEQNLHNARELFQSVLQSTFSQKGEDGEYQKVSNIADHCLGKMLDKRKNQGKPQEYLRNKNVRWFDFNLDDLLEMKFEDDEQERYSAQKDDVLICEGGYPGRAAIWESDEPIYFQKAIHRVRFHEPVFNKWFVYFLYHSDFTGDLRTHFTGAGIQHFTGKALADFEIPVGSTTKIKEHVTKLDALSEEIKALEAIYERKQSALAELKQSLLRKAFAGEL